MTCSFARIGECGGDVFVCDQSVDECLFFFKQKTAYELRISDWSSDVCSSDLGRRACRWASSIIWAGFNFLPSRRRQGNILGCLTCDQPDRSAGYLAAEAGAVIGLLAVHRFGNAAIHRDRKSVV